MDNRTFNSYRTKVIYFALSLFFYQFFSLYSFAASSSLTSKVSKETNIIILHTNDIHSHDLPFEDKGRVIGGMAKIAYLVAAIKKQHHNVLVVDAGDFFQGTPLFQRYGGEVEIESLNEIGYDVVELGNHEFDRGSQYLATMLKQAKFPVLACNLDCSPIPELDQRVKSGIVKEINGQKIAFIGVITPDLETKVLDLHGVKIKAPDGDWIKPIAQEIEYYQNQGINKIIVVSHCGVELDKTMAQALPAIDLIVGGHSHTRLTRPIWLQHPDGTYTAIVQTGCYGRALGKMEVSFDQLGHINKSKSFYHLIAITAGIKDNLELKDYLDQKEKPLLALRGEIVGYSKGDFWNHFANMPADSAIGDLVCDSLAEAGAAHGVQITFQNRGGIRAKLEKGPISEEKIQEILPFNNKVVYATLSGEALRSVLKSSFSGPLYGAFLDVHGLKITYDPQRDASKRIVSVFVQSPSNHWLSIDPKASYKIAVNDYTFKGGDGFDFSKATDVQYINETVAHALHDYIFKHKTVRPLCGGRIIPVNSQ